MHTGALPTPYRAQFRLFQCTLMSQLSLCSLYSDCVPTQNLILTLYTECIVVWLYWLLFVRVNLGDIRYMRGIGCLQTKSRRVWLKVNIDLGSVIWLGHFKTWIYNLFTIINNQQYLQPVWTITRSNILCQVRVKGQLYTHMFSWLFFKWALPVWEKERWLTHEKENRK